MKSTLTLLFLWLNASLFAQTSTFKAGATAGINFTQVDGDKEFGYQKKGVTAGLKGSIVLNRKWEISTELLYNIKGAVPSREEKKTNKRLISLNLHYAEIPILVKYAFIESKDGYYKWQVFGGLSYGRLLRSNFNIQKNDTSLDTTETNMVTQLGFKTSDVNVIVGASHYFSPRLGLSVRHTTSLTPFYKNPNPTTTTSQTPAGYGQFRNYFLSVQLFYDFVAPKVVVKRRKETPQ